MIETIESAIGIRVIGDSSDAEEWVAESTLDEGTKAALLRLVKRFPTQRYRRWREIRSAFGPVWFRVLRTVVDGIHAAGPLWMQFDQPDAFLAIHEQPAREIWYHSFLSYAPTSEYAAVRCGAHRLLFVGHWQERDYFLAIKADDDADTSVYALPYDRIGPVDAAGAPDAGEDSVGQVAPDAVCVAFSSYAEMLGHIAALKVGGTVVVMDGSHEERTQGPSTVAAFVERLKQGDLEFSTRFQEDAWGCRFLGDGRFERWSQNYMEGRDEREELDEAGVLALFSRYSAQTLHAGLIKRRSRQ
jgi:hypothetical protein